MIDDMKFEATMKCEKGHTQTLRYGKGFTKETVEDHMALMFGGHLHSLDRDVPPMSGCAFGGDTRTGAGGCGAKVFYFVRSLDSKKLGAQDDCG